LKTGEVMAPRRSHFFSGKKRKQRTPPPTNESRKKDVPVLKSSPELKNGALQTDSAKAGAGRLRVATPAQSRGFSLQPKADLQ